MFLQNLIKDEFCFKVVRFVFKRWLEQRNQESGNKEEEKTFFSR